MIDIVWSVTLKLFTRYLQLTTSTRSLSLIVNRQTINICIYHINLGEGVQ
jgi:hypothetical protein